MGSIEHEHEPVPTKGTFTVPILDDEPHSDPSTRAYMAPPKPKATSQITFPLVDFRGDVFNASSGGDYSRDEAFMRSHGFTAVNHTSCIKDMEGFPDADTMRDVYYAEVEDLVKEVTGCKSVFITNSKCREWNSICETCRDHD